MTRKWDGELSAAEWADLARRSRFNVQRAAEILEISPRTLHRWFVLGMNETPKKWFKRKQLELAVRQLADTESVKLAAYNAGYTQVQNFCRDFKKEYGCSAGRFLQSR